MNRADFYLPLVSPTIFRRPLLFVFTLLAIGGASTILAGPVFWSSPLSAPTILAGFPYGSAAAINNSGLIVGQSGDNAVEWSVGSPSSLVLIATNGGAMAINRFGDITGMLRDPRVGLELPFFWSSGTGSLLIDNVSRGWGVGINDSGQVVGLNRLSPGSAFLWTSDVGATDIGNFFPVGIDNAGEVAGNTNVNTQAIFWTKSAGIVNLPSLGGTTFVRSISSNGVMVGESVDLLGVSHLVSWTSPRTIVDLGPRGKFVPTSINNLGQIVGFDSVLGGGHTAAIWTRSGGDQALDVKGFETDSFAASINDNGQIAGVTDDPTPEPSTLSLSVAALVCLILGRGRARRRSACAGTYVTPLA